MTTDRRTFLQLLGITTVTFASQRAAAGRRAPAAAAGAARADPPFRVATVNHVSLSTPDYARSRNFYVDLLGMRVVWDDGRKCQVDFGDEGSPNGFYLVQGRPGAAAVAGHFAFGVPDFWAKRAAIRNELDRRGLSGVSADGESGWSVNGPSGYQVQLVPVKDPSMFPGAAQPCAVANSDACRQAYRAGLEHLASAPKPSGNGFRATRFKALVLHVPDVAKERDFYANVLGMRVVSDKPDECALRFGDNTLVLGRAGADGKPSCHEYAFVVEHYDAAKAKAELDRRGLAAKPGASRGAWSVSDPDGFTIEIGGQS